MGLFSEKDTKKIGKAGNFIKNGGEIVYIYDKMRIGHRVSRTKPGGRCAF
jgi:hypothetical protein